MKKGNDGTIERYKETECDKREMERKEIGEDRLKKDVVGQEGE